MSIQLAKTNRILERQKSTPWPEFFTSTELAKMQTWRDEYIPGLTGLPAPVRDIAESLESSCPSELQYTGRVLVRSAHTLQMRSFVGEVQRDESGNFSASHSTEDAGTIDRPAETYLQQEKVVYREGFAAWLKAHGVEPSPMTRAWLDSDPQLATPAPAAATPTPVAPSASDAPMCDLSILATREQLIGAFGRFTGMDASWFKNIKDTPALLAARKVTGQGGRGHIAEPLFCPFEVMQWLADSKRRKGRKLSTEKAWELLEKNFSKVHSAHSVADPRVSD